MGEPEQRFSSACSRAEPNGKYGYSAIASVLQTDEANPHHLTGFTHNEQHAGTNPSGTFTASISQLESFDGGKTWKQVGGEPVVRGDDPVLPPGTKPSRAGQPCEIVKDGYVYLYYTDWGWKHVCHAAQIYLAQAKIRENGTIGNMEFYKGDAFGQGETNLAPVVRSDTKPGSYVALASISYNTAIKRYLGVVGLNGAFGITTSSDGIHWNTPQQLMTFIPHSKLKPGDTFVSYPTLVSHTSLCIK